MNIEIKPIAALLTGAALLAVFSQTASAALNESGSATLGATGTSLASDQLEVDWSVVQVGAEYTYTYTIVNPTGDVTIVPVTTENPTGTGDSEIVDQFILDVNTSLVQTISGGVYQDEPTSDSIRWVFGPSIVAGSSATVSLTSLYGPFGTDASASDAKPPSPWGSYPNGGMIPAPGTVPDGASTMVLLGGVMALLPFGRRFIGKK